MLTNLNRPVKCSPPPFDFQALNSLTQEAVAPLLQNPLDKILRRFTIDDTIPLCTEPHISELFDNIKKQRSSDGSFSYQPIKYNDPIYKEITIPDWMVAVINTPPVLRLAAIGQMPFTGHSRLSHSIGVGWLGYQLGQRWNLSEQQTRELVCSGLVHDTPHGAYSHFYERLYITNKSDFFNHDQRLPALIHSTELSKALLTVGVDPDTICAALKDPKNNWTGHLAKDLLDRIDYNIRDSFYSDFKPDTKSAIKRLSMRLLNSIKFEDDQVFFCDRNSYKLAQFMCSRRYTFTTLAYNPTVSIVESLLGQAIRSKLATLDRALTPKVVQALSLYTDAQLNALLDQPALKAFRHIAAHNSVPLVSFMTNEDLSDHYKIMGSIKPKEILNLLAEVNTDLRQVTWLVAIRPASSPAMSVKIRKKTGDILDMRMDHPQSSLSAQGSKTKQIGFIAISAYDQNGGLLTPNDNLQSDIKRKFSEQGWLKP
jgi:HD superfamily phosphohydrolase